MVIERQPAISSVEHVTPRKLVARFGATESWWSRRLPELCRRGVASKRGRKFFARLADIEAWLAEPGAAE